MRNSYAVGAVAACLPEYAENALPALRYKKYHGQLIGGGNAEVVKHIGNKQRFNNKGNTYRHSAQNYSAYGKAASAGLVYLTENAYYKPGDCTKEE